MTYLSSSFSSTASTAFLNYCRFLFRFKKRFEKLNFTSKQLRWPLIPGTRINSSKYCSSFVSSSATARFYSSSASCSGVGMTRASLEHCSAFKAKSSRVDNASTTSYDLSRSEANAIAVSVICFISSTLRYIVDAAY